MEIEPENLDVGTLLIKMSEEIEKLKKRVSELEKHELSGGLAKASAKRTKKSEQPSGCTQLKKAFLEGYEKAFGHEYPRWGARENGQASNLLKSISLVKAVWYLDWYFVWKDPQIVREGHPFTLFTTSIVKLDSQIKRKGRYFDAVAEANVMRRLEMEKREEHLEVAYGSVRARQQRIGDGNDGNGVQVGFGCVRQISDKANEELSGVGSGPSSGGMQRSRDDQAGSEKNS